MADDRRDTILRAVVEEYIKTSQPVSSSQVARSPGVSASSATIRNDMALLERDGFLQQPHTSAGRIPTDRGYRFFVDQLNTPGELGAAQAQDVRSFFDAASGEIEQMLHETGRLLSNLTGSAAVVVGPDVDSTTVRSLQIVTLGQRTALVVVVFSDGSVEKRTMELAENVDESWVQQASNRLSEHARGKALSTVNETPASGNADIDGIAGRALQALKAGHNDETADKVFVGGASRLASAFDAVEKVRNVLTILEQQYVVVTLIRDLLDRGMSVSIGAEHKLQPLADCSLVVAPTIIQGEQRGSVAILGPTRMDYSQAMAAVTLVSRHLGDRLTDTGK